MLLALPLLYLGLMRMDNFLAIPGIGQSPPILGLLYILINSEPKIITITKPVLALGVFLVGGLLVPFHRFTAVFRNPQAVLVAKSQSIFGISISQIRRLLNQAETFNHIFRGPRTV